MRATAPALDVLHLADSHLRAADRRRLHFLEVLADRIPPVDLIVMTGDMIENDSGIDPLLKALEPLKARYGKAFVLGSHDYFQSEFKLPIKYLLGRQTEIKAPLADTQRMVHGLTAAGWIDMSNRTEILDTPLGQIRLTGVDDPYLKRHRTEHIARGREVLAIGLTHSPDVVTPYILNGFDLVVAGHTHGGQLRAPFKGALVTNSKLPTALAAGVHRIGHSALHVSPGLGTSEHMRVRFLCRPEVTVLHLRPIDN